MGEQQHGVTSKEPHDEATSGEQQPGVASGD